MWTAFFFLALGADADIDTHLNEYFITYRGMNGLIQDRASTPNVFSVAATGFGMDVWAIAALQGDMTPLQAALWIHQTLDFMHEKNPAKNRGWLYHFVDNDGSPQLNSGVSSIDTAIFYLGAKQAAQRLKDRTLEEKVDSAIKAIDVDWMIKNSPSRKLISHGLRWQENEPVFLSSQWDSNSEGILIYRLFNLPYEPVYEDFSLPLFAYYFPLCFLPQEKLHLTLQQAIDYHLAHFGYIGLTATDTADGYQFRPLGYFSPLALYTISQLDARAAAELVRRQASPKLHSRHLKTDWESSDRIGIDEGAAIVIYHPLR